MSCHRGIEGSLLVQANRGSGHLTRQLGNRKKGINSIQGASGTLQGPLDFKETISGNLKKFALSRTPLASL